MSRVVWVSQEPAEVELRAVVGTKWDFLLTITDDTTPVNLADHHAEFLIAKDWDSENLLVLTDGEGITLGGSAGTVAGGEDACTLAAGEYVFVLAIIDPDGTRNAFLTGPLIVEASGKVPTL